MAGVSVGWAGNDPSESGLDFSPIDYTTVPNVTNDQSGIGNPSGVITAVSGGAANIITATNPPSTITTAGGVRATGTAATALASQPGAASNIGVGSNSLLILLVVAAVIIAAIRR